MHEDTAEPVVVGGVVHEHVALAAAVEGRAAGAALRRGGIIRQYDEGRQRINTLRLAELDTGFPGLVSAVLASAD
ncbi:MULTISPECIES: hypothetical protein [Prauserella]|uniref:hypothetical protein n=1 Tax=Prauserella TaxID=142577 RepID=UPI0018F5FAC9|nr:MULTISPECIES: hypothetical protein [Prauserella]